MQHALHCGVRTPDYTGPSGCNCVYPDPTFLFGCRVVERKQAVKRLVSKSAGLCPAGTQFAIDQMGMSIIGYNEATNRRPSLKLGS
jgi:hypothetical protein